MMLPDETHQFGAWIHEDQLPRLYPYDAMFNASLIVGGVRMFPPFDATALIPRVIAKRAAHLMGAVGAIRAANPTRGNISPGEVADMAAMQISVAISKEPRILRHLDDDVEFAIARAEGEPGREQGQFNRRADTMGVINYHGHEIGAYDIEARRRIDAGRNRDLAAAMEVSSSKAERLVEQAATSSKYERDRAAWKEFACAAMRASRPFIDANGKPMNTVDIADELLAALNKRFPDNAA